MLSGRLLQPVACGKPSVPGRAGLGQEEFLGPAPLLTSHLPPPPPPPCAVSGNDFPVQLSLRDATGAAWWSLARRRRCVAWSSLV